MNARSLAHDEAVYFRNLFRDARTIALRDAEAFEELVFTVERLGSALTKNVLALGRDEYKQAIDNVALQSPLAACVPDSWRECLIPFRVLYQSVRVARNDALHQGALARHLTVHAIQLAIILEDAMMQNLSIVGDYMVPNPVCAALWQPVGFIRQAMLANAFSYMPVLTVCNDEPEWHIISDYAVACYLRSGKRDQRLATPLEKALREGMDPAPARLCTADFPITEALSLAKDGPVLVHRKESKGELVGIITTFDLL